MELGQVLFPEPGTRAAAVSAVVILLPLLLSLLPLWVYYLIMQNYFVFDS